MTITMYDAIDNSQFPAGAPAYAAYVNGSLADQPNYDYIVSKFPSAEHLSIALSSDYKADALDVESGAATAAEIPAWHARQVIRGISRPVIYASASTMKDSVLPVLSSAKIARAATRLWTAHYGAGEHICGPGSCGALPVDADGTQWTALAMGRDLDQSLLVPGFFGAAPVPPSWSYGSPWDIVVTPGHTNFHASWNPPSGAPQPVDHYVLFVYKGQGAGMSKTPVTSYPRSQKGTTTDPDMGDLQAGTEYTLHIIAKGPNGSHAGPFGSKQFTTGG